MGMPAQAEYGLTPIFYYLFAAIVFLIPTALVAAELAAAYPKQGEISRLFNAVGFRAILGVVAVLRVRRGIGLVGAFRIGLP